MKKYRNVSRQRLYLDCITHTTYIEPGWELFLPLCRDVRFNLRAGNLILVKKREEKSRKLNKRFPKQKRSKKKKWKPVGKQTDSKLKKTETE